MQNNPLLFPRRNFCCWCHLFRRGWTIITAVQSPIILFYVHKNSQSMNNTHSQLPHTRLVTTGDCELAYRLPMANAAVAAVAPSDQSRYSLFLDFFRLGLCQLHWFVEFAETKRQLASSNADMAADTYWCHGSNNSIFKLSTARSRDVTMVTDSWRASTGRPRHQGGAHGGRAPAKIVRAPAKITGLSDHVPSACHLYTPV